MSTAPALDERQVRQLVEQALSSRQARDYILKVETVVRQPDFWQVAVRPNCDGVKALEYAQIVTEVEEHLRDTQRLQVVLTPVLV